MTLVVLGSLITYFSFRYFRGESFRYDWRLASILARRLMGRNLRRYL